MRIINCQRFSHIAAIFERFCERVKRFFCCIPSESVYSKSQPIAKERVTVIPPPSFLPTHAEQCGLTIKNMEPQKMVGELGQKLESGTFGTVFIIDEKTVAKVMAIKEGSDTAKTDLAFSLWIAENAKPSDCLLQMISYDFSQSSVTMILPRCEKDLFYEISQRDQAARCDISARMEESKRWMRDVLKALLFLHGKGFIHRDVKPENVLLEDGKRRAVLCDFGFMHTEDPAPKNVKGSREYTHSEFLRGVYAQNKSGDRWSLLATFYTSVTGYSPSAIKKVGRAPFLQDWVREMKELMAWDPSSQKELLLESVARVLEE